MCTSPWVVCSLLALVPAAQAAEVASPQYGVAPIIRLQGLEVKEQGSAKPREAGSVLPSNRDVAINISLEGAGHIYLVKSDASGRSHTLFPAVGVDPLRAAGGLRIPSAGSWLRLSPTREKEEICVLATAEPLPESARLCPDLPLDRRPDDPEPKGSSNGSSSTEKDKPPKDVKGPGHGARWLRSIRITIQD